MGILSGWFSKKEKGVNQRLFSSYPGELERERERYFLENGSKLLEELITSCKDRCQCNPIRNFSATQVLEATEYFKSSFCDDGRYKWYKGALDGRPVLIKKRNRTVKEELYLDIAISSLMSSHKYSLKLLGCCLEFSYPVLVYEDEEIIGPLNVSRGTDHSKGLALSWRQRLKIAKDVAYAITYLHTAFPRPIIHRDISASNVWLDKNYVPKLCNFNLAISIPEGETYVEDTVVGKLGYLDPHYARTQIITEKTDVYNFGVLLLVLVTGKKPFYMSRPTGFKNFCRNVMDLVEKEQFNDIVDPKMLEEEGGGNEEQRKLQFRAFIELALRCARVEMEDRPRMIDVAKELVKINRFVDLPLTS